MAKQIFSNNASATLAVSLIIADTTVQVQSGYGTLFPSPTNGDWFLATLEDNGGNSEIVKCTARSGDLLTVVRAQESTSAQAFTNTVTRVELRNTKGTLERFLQRSGDTLAGNLNLGGYTVDSGALGSGITGVPALAYSVGMIMLWSGSAGSIPTGWKLCNGANSTPDLRGRFIVGAGGTYNPGDTGGAATASITTSSEGAHDHSGATGSVTLTEAEMPAHNHRIYGWQGSGSGSADQNKQLGVSGVGLAASYSPGTSTLGYVDTNGSGAEYTENTGGGGAHSHTVSSVAAHSHTATVDTLPPYYALCYIMYTG